VQWIEQVQPELRQLFKRAAEHLAGKENVGRLPTLITQTTLEAQLQHALGMSKKFPNANHPKRAFFVIVFFLQPCRRPVQISLLYYESGTI